MRIAVAMVICDGLVAVCTPKHIKCFALSCCKDGGLSASLVSEVPLSYSVGFADASFIEYDTPSRRPKDLLVPCHIFSQPLPPDVDLYCTFDMPVTFHPSIDACGSISWHEGINKRDEAEKPLAFCATSLFHSGEREDIQPSLKFTHPDLPALYAMGVRDYDPGLGLAIFGNYFGEFDELEPWDPPPRDTEQQVRSRLLIEL